MTPKKERRAAQARSDEIDDAIVEGRKRRGVPVGALGRGWSAFDAANPGTLVRAALEGDVRPLAKAWEAERHRRTDLRAGIIAELARRSADERAHMRLLAVANGLVIEALDLAEPSAAPSPAAGTGWYLNTVSIEERVPFQPAERWCPVRVVDSRAGANARERYKVDILEGLAAGRTVAVPRASLRSVDEVLGADRLLSKQHEAALRSHEGGDGGAVAARDEARRWLRLIDRTAQQLTTAHEVRLFHEALAEHAKHDREGQRRVVPEGLIEHEIGLANEARERAGELLYELQGYVGDLERDLRRANDFEEAARIERWNMAGDGEGRGVRRATLREEVTDSPALRADRALLAKAKAIEADAVAREANGPTAAERREAERKVLESAGRRVQADAPPPVDLDAPPTSPPPAKSDLVDLLDRALPPVPAASPPSSPRASPPAARRSSRASVAPPIPIVCDLCRNRRPRASGADQTICASCLHAARVKDGTEQPSPPPELDPELRSLREMLTFNRWVPPGRVPTRDEMESARRALWDAQDDHEAHPSEKTARALDNARRYYDRLYATNEAVADRVEAEPRRNEPSSEAAREMRRLRLPRFVNGDREGA